MHVFFRNLRLVIVFSFALTRMNAQESESQHQNRIFVQHDNDFLFAIDRYYTAGTFVGYSRVIDSDFIFKRKPDNPLQLDFLLGQETYTPRELFEEDFDLLERPYAGYLFVSGAVSAARKNHLWSLQAELGLAGPQSLAGDLQVQFHKLINEFIPTWAGEIGNSFHINTRGQFIQDFEIGMSDFFSHFTTRSTVSLGTKATFAKQEVLLYFGNRAATGITTAHNRISSAYEFFGFVGGGYRYVVNNALVEGHPLDNFSSFTLDAVPSVWNMQAGVVYSGVRNTYSLIYNYQTRETFREGRSQYMAMRFARTF